MTHLHWTVLPLVLHVVLTFIVGLMSLRARIATVRSGKTKINSIANSSAAWPEDVRKLGNNFDNQFQVPMLVYACVALLAATGLADVVTVALAWAFLAARVMHSVEQVGRNLVPRRMVFFLSSYAAANMMWLWFALRFFVIG